MKALEDMAEETARPEPEPIKFDENETGDRNLRSKLMPLLLQPSKGNSNGS